LLFAGALLLDHLLQLGIVPVGHRIVLVAHVHINGPLFDLVLLGKIVGELALVALGAGALFEEGADHRLGIGALLHLLSLYRLEDQRHLALFGQLLLLLLLALVAILARMLSAGLDLLLHLLDELLLLVALLVLQPEGFVLPMELHLVSSMWILLNFSRPGFHITDLQRGGLTHRLSGYEAYLNDFLLLFLLRLLAGTWWRLFGWHLRAGYGNLIT